MLLATTAVAVALGFVVYQTRPTAPARPPRPLVFPPASGTIIPGPAGDINIPANVPGTT